MRFLHYTHVNKQTNNIKNANIAWRNHDREMTSNLIFALWYIGFTGPGYRQSNLNQWTLVPLSLCFRRQSNSPTFFYSSSKDEHYSIIFEIFARKRPHAHYLPKPKTSLFMFRSPFWLCLNEYKKPLANCIHNPTFWRCGLVSSSGVFWCCNAAPPQYSDFHL